MISSMKIPKAYSEAYSFINALGDSYINKIPISIYSFIKNNRDVNYNPKFDSNQKVEKGMISQEGLSLIAALNLQYWCKNENEKLELKKTYINNTEKENEKYSYDNIFKSGNKEIDNTINVENNIEEKEHVFLIEYKESILKKIISKIKNIFNFRNK